MKMVIIEPLGVEQEALLKTAHEILSDRVEIVYYAERTTDTAQLIERGKDADIIVEANLPLSSEVIDGFEKCTLLSVAFTGVDHIAMDKCKEKGITVCNCSGYSNEAVADLVFAMILALYRELLAADGAVRGGRTKEGLKQYELSGKNFGIVGTGAIGLTVAKIAQAFGCRVYAYSRTIKDISGITYVSLDELLSVCDIVTLHVPSNEQTKNMINAEKIALMKKTAILINCARGPVLDSHALADALNAGKIAGAGIDVFEEEPPVSPDNPLLNCKNTILTPHIGFATKEALEKRAVIVFENVAAFLDKKPQNVM